MYKYTIIIPIYNSEKYIKKCLESVINQTFNNYEVILVNDGSIDDSEKIIDEYASKYNFIKKINQKNAGVSSARNIGVEEASGEFFTFVDSDDYIDENLLQTIDENIKENIDVLSYNIQGNVKPEFDLKTGEEAIVEFINKSNLFDTPVGYMYRTKYFKQNKFEYAVGKEHEDFGLTPLVITSASTVKSIKHELYHYVRREGSITKTDNYEKIIKKSNDMLYHFDFLYKTVNTNMDIDKNTKEIFNSFLANSLIAKSHTLEKKEKKKYIEELKKRKIPDLLLSNNIKRLLKKIFIKIRM